MEAALKMARLLAIAHIVVGISLTCFGIADAILWPVSYPAISAICFGVWVSDHSVIEELLVRTVRKCHANVIRPIYFNIAKYWLLRCRHRIIYLRFSLRSSS